MLDQSEKNRRAWEYRAYEFWNSQNTPEALAEYIKKDPLARLRHHKEYFQDISEKKIANPCGSNGRIAVPLALLGAEVTVFDISSENKRYALELAASAGVRLTYELGDINTLDVGRYENYFDISYSEGGVLHYFSDLHRFIGTLFAILRPGGKLILSDFHPFRKILRTGSSMMSVRQTGGDYFDSRVHMGEVAYQHFFPEEEQAVFPQTELRFYTMGEIINAVISGGFKLLEFVEHPNFEDKRLPGEFTIYAEKE